MAPLEFPRPALTDGIVLLREWREQDTQQRQAGFADPLPALLLAGHRTVNPR